MIKLKKRYLLIILLNYLATGCFINSKTNDKVYSGNLTVMIDTVNFFDRDRSRRIPVALFFDKTSKNLHKKIVIFSHGYGQNKGGAYLAYLYLTTFLASNGYFVASIQHELPTDSLIPQTGIAQVVRRPFWERGSENILFVINQLKTLYPDLDFKHLTLIGHSNGADMTALFAQKYWGMIVRIITLDNRRMPLPRTKQPKIFSIRSSDQLPDVGVLPTDEEQKKYGITIIKLQNTKHDNMDDSGNTNQKKEINDLVLQFINR